MADLRRPFATLTLLALLASGGSAAQAQQLEEVESDLATTMQALSSANKEKQALEKRNARLLSELANLQRELVSITSKVQQQEKLLSELEANLLNLRDEEREKQQRLKKHKKEQMVTVQGMLKLSRIPPEIVVAMPGDFATSLRTSKVLALTTQGLAEQAAQISQELEAIHALQVQIQQNHQQITRQKGLLEKSEQVLSTRLAERSTIQNQLSSEQEQRQAEVRRLSRESNTLKELMGELEKRHREAAEKVKNLALIPSFKPDIATAPAPRHIPSPPRATPEFAQARGSISLPAEGKIFIFYGDKMRNGDDSRGISIRTRASAKVTSPFAGEIVYTGSFLDYGNMVILRHGENYHSLLAGFARITAALGQRVIGGEPIGEMGRNEDETALYMEIRKDNRPIDPIPWLENQQHATRQQLLR